MSSLTSRTLLPRCLPDIYRHISTFSPLYGNDSDIEYIIETNLDKTTHRRQDESPTILTTRREALSLYREIMRITSLFDWPNEHGMVWRDVLRQSAREEFEQARHERDPEIVNRMLVVGRDAVHQVAEKFIEKRKHVHGADTNPPRH